MNKPKRRLNLPDVYTWDKPEAKPMPDPVVGKTFSEGAEDILRLMKLQESIGAKNRYQLPMWSVQEWETFGEALLSIYSQSENANSLLENLEQFLRDSKMLVTD